PSEPEKRDLELDSRYGHDLGHSERTVAGAEAIELAPHVLREFAGERALVSAVDRPVEVDVHRRSESAAEAIERDHGFGASLADPRDRVAGDNAAAGKVWNVRQVKVEVDVWRERDRNVDV